MTLQKAVDIFQVLIDKYGSPNVIDSEVVDYINMAINEYLNRLFPDSQGGVVNYEMDSNTVVNLKPLIWNVSISMNGSGIVTDTALHTALRTASGDNSAKVFRIGSVGLTSSGVTYPVKFIKNNNRWSFERNIFKKPTVTKPAFTFIGDGYQFYPTSASTPLTINVVKTPKVLTTSDLASEMEFSDYSVYNIIAIAIKFAATSLRDEEVLQDIRLASLQTQQ